MKPRNRSREYDRKPTLKKPFGNKPQRKFENIKQYFCLLFALCFLYSPLLQASGKAQGETCTDIAQCSQGLECNVRPYSEHKDFGNITNSQIIDLMEENRSVTTIAAHDLSSPNDFSNLVSLTLGADDLLGAFLPLFFLCFSIKALAKGAFLNLL